MYVLFEVESGKLIIDDVEMAIGSDDFVALRDSSPLNTFVQLNCIAKTVL